MLKSKRIFLYSLLALLFFVTLRWLFIEPYRIPSRSMEPTLLVYDHILVNKSSYGWRLPFTQTWVARWSEPKLGEVVVFRAPEKARARHPEAQFMVKRVAGVPGDEVVIQGRRQTLLSGQYYVLGDNPAESADSRQWGFVPEENLLGRAVLVWLSCEDVISFEFPVCDPQQLRWPRFFMPVQGAK